MIDKQSFERWLSSYNKENSGKVRSYLTALDDIDVILRFLITDFAPPNVFELPKHSLESLRKFFINQAKNSESSVLTAIPNLHGPSYFKNRFYSASVQALLDYLHHSQPSLKTEFVNWLKTLYLTPKGESPGETAIDNYVNCLDSVNKPDGKGNPSSHHNEHLWYNIYEYLYGTTAKDVFSIDSLSELEAIYGGLRKVVDYANEETPPGVVVAHYNEIKAWINSEKVKKSGWIKSAFNRYSDFLKWRETQSKGKEDTSPAIVDRLSVALKYFAERRSDEDQSGGKSYDDIYAEVRAEAAKINGDYLVSCDYEAFRNTLNARQVANSFFSRHTDDDKRRLGDFIAAVRQDPRDISFYLVPGNQPNVPGIGPAMLTAFLTRTRPDLFVFFTEQMFESVKFLGLTAEDALPALSTDAYNTYKGIQTTIRDRMREMGIKAENGNDADYLTVNEFTWFVSENKDLIMETIMKKQWKPVNSQAKKKSGTRKLSDAFANDEMLKRLAAALRTKPFAILAGHSGTGKSQLVRRLAYMTCNNELLAKESEGKTAPGNYCMVQVKPNWHDSTDLLGYYSEMGGRHYVNTPFVEFVCKAYAYPDTPFFVCLDEMNLAPVEQYFAEYLSAIESMEKKDGIWVTDPLVEVDKADEKADPDILDQIMKGAASTEAAEWIQKHGLTIPKNLFVVGTVNMDETTCQFSRKVLDRAMTLLMNKVSFADMAQSKKPSDEELLDDDGVKFFLEGAVRGEVGSIESGLLDAINEPLKNTAFVVAYRFANEYALYEAAWAKLKGVDLASASAEDKKNLAAEALDHVVLMKLLPRIHGEKSAVKKLFGYKDKNDQDVPGLKNKLPSGGLSATMMDAILARDDEYLTFWP